MCLREYVKNVELLMKNNGWVKEDIKELSLAEGIRLMEQQGIGGKR